MARNSFHDFAPARALPSTNEKGSRLWLPRSVRFLLRCGPQSARSVLRRGPPRLLRCFALRPPCCFCRRLPGSGLPGIDVVRIQDDPNLLETLGQPGQVASVPHCPPELVLAAGDQLPLPGLARAAGRTLYHAHGPRNTVHEVEQERLCLDSERLDPVEEEAPAFEPGQELRGVVPRTGEPALERLPDQPLVGPAIDPEKGAVPPTLLPVHGAGDALALAGALSDHQGNRQGGAGSSNRIECPRFTTRAAGTRLSTFPHRENLSMSPFPAPSREVVLQRDLRDLDAPLGRHDHFVHPQAAARRTRVRVRPVRTG